MASSDDTTRIGIIGCGFRARSLIVQMQRSGIRVIVSAILDPNAEEAISLLSAEGIDTSAVRVAPTLDSLLSEPGLSGLIIGTRCSHHTQYAVPVIRTGLPLFLEKPVATSASDLKRLKNAMDSNPQSQVVVSFPLRLTAIVQEVRRLITSGTLGPLSQVQAVNNVPYGIVYYQDWYRDENETGGLFLQKATHDFDYINYLLGESPVCIAAVKSKVIYKGERPAGLKCRECVDKSTCQESPFHPEKLQTQAVTVGDEDRKCAFAEDTGNEDSGSALIGYESGLHVSYTQNFVARGNARRRGSTIIGYDATIEFDFHSMQLTVHRHRPAATEIRSFRSVGGHGGGDDALVRNFADVCLGKDASKSPLEAGILSALMCLKATESAELGVFQPIDLD